MEAPLPLIGSIEKQNLNKFCDYHGDRGNNANDCYHMKKQIEEAVASGKLAHLVKDIRRDARTMPRDGVAIPYKRRCQELCDGIRK
ncbi:hypothetical protein Tco_0708979 [Tanacetum coccineum]